MGNIVVDADGKMIFERSLSAGKRSLLQFIEDTLHHGRRKLFGRKPITATNHLRQLLQPALL